MKKCRYVFKVARSIFYLLPLCLCLICPTAYAAPSDYYDSVQKVYIGYYQRPADPAGLIYWAGRLDSSGGNLYEVIEAFANSQESQSLYGTINSGNIATVVNNIYLALFGRDAEVAGRDWYVAEFNAGRFTAATIMLNVLYGAQGSDLQSVTNKLAASNIFTKIIDPELDGSDFQVTYQGDPDAIAGRNFLSMYATSTQAPTQSSTRAYIQSNIADASDPIMANASATGTVASNATSVSTINTGTGARITVPIGAVPQTSSGGVGSVNFSIENDTTSTYQVPTGVTQIGNLYRLGPSGTIFSQPVAVTLPVTGTHTQDELQLYRVNPTTGASEPYGGVYDSTEQTITTQTYEFSPWYVGWSMPDNMVSGCLNVDNTGSSIWRTLVVNNFTPKYPPAVNMIGHSATWSNSSFDWANRGNWYIPQGTYAMCVEGEVNGQRKHSADIPVSVDQPWRYNTPNCTSMGISSAALSQSGPCAGAPTPTPSVGTGNLQISLSWNADPGIDLDLYVTEPGGETISYLNDTSAAGGALDQDNQCWQYVNGQSENIYWTNPPAGQYTIKVEFFGRCESNSATSVPFTVRVVNNGVTTTYTGTANESNTEPVTVTTITSTGGAANCGPGPFSNKVTVGTGSNGCALTGEASNFSLGGGAIYLFYRVESASGGFGAVNGSATGVRFVRLYINKPIQQKDSTGPVFRAPNVNIDSFRVSNPGTYTLEAYAVDPVYDIGTEHYIGSKTINVTQ